MISQAGRFHKIYQSKTQSVRLRPPRYLLTDSVRDADDQGVAHAECPVDVGHAGIGPTFWKALQLVELVWDQPPEPPVGSPHDMLAPGSRPPPPHL